MSTTTDPRDHLKRWMAEKPIDANPTCIGCGGPHPFDTSIPSVLWNRVVRAAELPDYLCTTCIVRAFAHAGEGFTAELYGDGFNGLTLEVRVNSKESTAARDVNDENNRLRCALGDILAMSERVLSDATRARL